VHATILQVKGMLSSGQKALYFAIKVIVVDYESDYARGAYVRIGATVVMSHCNMLHRNIT